MEKRCIICDKTGGGSFSEASSTSFATILKYLEDWSNLGEHMNDFRRVKDLKFTKEVIHKYHRECYKGLCNKTHLSNAQEKHEKDIVSATAKSKRGRSSNEPSSSKFRKTFDQEMCVFCQLTSIETTHSVSSPDMGQKFLNIKETTKSDDVRARFAFLYNPKDAFAQNMKYHRSCLRKETRALDTVDYSPSEEENIGKAICDIEIVHIVKSEIIANCESEFPKTNMNSIQDSYRSLLAENNVAFDPDTNFKPHIKGILLESIPDIEFAKRGPKPEIVFSSKTKETLMSKFFENTELDEDMESLYKASQIIRKEISRLEDWNFTGSFDDFTTPMKLQQLMRWIISGPHTVLNVNRELQIEKSSRNLAQHIVSSFRSRRQVAYETKTVSKFQKNKKTPLTVGLGLTTYQANRSRSDVETLNDLQLAVTYEDILKTTTRTAIAIKEDMKENSQGIHIPPFVKQGIRPLFAIDNIDLGSDAGSLHGADLLIAQKDEDGIPILGKDLKLNLNIQDKAFRQSLGITYYDCNAPQNPIVSCTAYKLDTLRGTSSAFVQAGIIWLLLSSLQVLRVTGISDTSADSQGLDINQEDDDLISMDFFHEESSIAKSTPDDSLLWAGASDSTGSHGASDITPLLSPDTRSQKSPTWSTFNSLVSEKTAKWNVGIAAPLFTRSPTEWPVLFTILKQAQRINCLTVGEGIRPVITLDGDLYDRAVKLKDYKSNWCIRLGALHITMAALKCLGKYIEGSGLELAWEESGLYGSATVRQILDGRHIYRCIEAHTVTLVAVFTLYVEAVFSHTERAEYENQLSQMLDTFALYSEGKTDGKAEKFKSEVVEVSKALSDKHVFERLDEWKKSGKGIQKFLTNYMDQVQVLLLFIAATRTCNWKLHLAKMEELLPYFHAHDQYNYGRWGPLYVADMLELQTTDHVTWKFLDEGNFAISKHNIPFSAINPDHGIEQEHKKMKIKGGFIGITGDEHALEKYFIIAPTLARFAQEFKDYAGIEMRQPSSLHHEVFGEKGSRMIANAAKITKVVTRQGNPFLKNDMYNLVTFAVVPSNVASNIENRDRLGRQALEKFVSERMTEKTVQFWDSQKKNNWCYFKNVGATVQTKVNDKLTSIKQERKLLSQLLVVAKSRSSFAIKDAIGDFEFSVAPPSNFSPDGSMIMLSGKSQVASLILNMPLPESTSTSSLQGGSPLVLIIDAMCIVNMIPKTPDLLKAVHFANKFVDIVARMGSAYDELRVVFDQYIPGSLKETTRDKRILKVTPIRYHVNDDTDIKNLKAFLSHIETKAELTKYLSDKLMTYYKDRSQKLIVMHHTAIVANVPLSVAVCMPEMEAGGHNLEEGDQLVLLNAFDVMYKNPNATLDVFSVDTDVFVLLTGHCTKLPRSTTLIRKKGERISIFETYKKLGHKRTEALIGWYAFKGTDNTGSFAGKGVASHFKAFMEADDQILGAFSKFGLTDEMPNGILDQMERYLCLLYGRSNKNVCSVRELRWTLFAQKNKEGAQLPPTLGTLVPHTWRAYHMALVWKASQKPCPKLPSPTGYYWQLEDDRLKPVYCIKAPAPEALLALRKCNCKTNCTRKSCGCLKNQLPCSDLCGCGDECENSAHDRPEDADESL